MDIHATVTTSTETELKLTAKWSVVWLQGGGSTTIVHKLLPDEIEQEPGGAFQEMEIGGYQPRPDLGVGERFLLTLYFPSGSR
jgi:hypothetical protein